MRLLGKESIGVFSGIMKGTRVVLRPMIMMIGLLSLSGCSTGSLLLSGGIAANMIMTEPRGMSAMGSDAWIHYDLLKKLSKAREFSQSARVVITSYNQTVLLTGQVPKDVVAQHALDCAKTTGRVKKVFNQIDVAAPATLWQRTQDGLLTGWIRTKLWMTSGVRSNQFKIVTEKKTVFIIGKTQSEAVKQVASVAQHTMGVQKVVQVVELTGLA